MDKAELSKILSYVLRHAPNKYNLELDEDGWVNIDDLIISIKSIHKEYSDLTYFILRDVVQTSQKKRHEIKDGKIRALYGHSIGEKIKKQLSKPPDILYHGTTCYNLQNIKSNGINRMQRQYVHLSEDIDLAEKIALRRTKNPVILKVNAKQAYSEGIRFYYESGVWLSDNIPFKYIEVEFNV
jgi:putative RNA 2'-phosphotransferase